VGGEGVAQRVRVDAASERRGLDPAVDHPARGAVGQPAAAGVEEDRIVVAVADLSHPLPALAPGAQRGRRRLAERRHSLLAPFADDAQGPPRQVEVGPVERDRLGDAQAGRVQQLEQGAVAPGEVGVALRRLEQRLDLSGAKMAGQGLGRLGRRHPRRRIGGELADPAGPAEEGLERRQRAPLALASDAGAGERGDEGADRERVDVARPHLRLRSAEEIAGEELVETLEVAAVGAQGVLGERALPFEMVEEGVDQSPQLCLQAAISAAERAAYAARRTAFFGSGSSGRKSP